MQDADERENLIHVFFFFSLLRWGQALLGGAQRKGGRRVGSRVGRVEVFDFESRRFQPPRAVNCPAVNMLQI